MSVPIKCPVCNATLEPKIADSHVNTCLDKGSQLTQSTKSGAKRQNDWAFMNSPPVKKRFLKDNEDSASKSHNSQLRTYQPPLQTNNSMHSKNNTDSKKPTVASSTTFNSAQTGNKNAKPANTLETEFEIPLAEVVRPQRVEEMVGQEAVLGEGSALRRLLETCHFTSLILWGPPGCGKTSLARVIAQRCRRQSDKWAFMQLSATTAGTADVKSCIEAAKNNKRLLKKRTVLFIDEIHRFNKTQQDTLLACIEDGTLVFVGATTENPSFQVNNALLSRCKVVVMEKLCHKGIREILVRAMRRYKCCVKRKEETGVAGGEGEKGDGDVVVASSRSNYRVNDADDGGGEGVKKDDVLASGVGGGVEGVHVACKEELTVGGVEMKLDEGLKSADVGVGGGCEGGGGDGGGSRWLMQEDALEMVVDSCDGDARKALNCVQSLLELKMLNRDVKDGQEVVIGVQDVASVLTRSMQYDRKGDEHYNSASALQKSIRGSDDNAAMYWLCRMIEGGEDPLFIARRLVVIASEDIGLADANGLPLAVSTFQACQLIGMPECAINLAHCTAYLARAGKSNHAYAAMKSAREAVRQHKGALPAVPLHLRNAPTPLMQQLGYHRGYQYNHDYDQPVQQTYLPDCLLGKDFFSRR